MNRTYLKTRDGQAFAVDDEGLIHISSNENNNESVYDKILKQAKILSASYWALWCIFQNDKLSLLIPSSSVPLNDQVITYENQRWSIWYLIFTNNLLPTDPHSFSSDDGSKSLPKDSFKLPSDCWSWDGDWYYNDSNMSDGWEYAVDFRYAFSKSEFTGAFVRRRKWMRNLKFNSYDRSIKIDLPSGQNGVVDVSVGGWNIPFSEKGFLAVWIVSTTGKLFYRQNVTYRNVEGTDWKEVELPPETKDLVSCTCSNKGRLWCIRKDGSFILRSGITRETPFGTYWIRTLKPNVDVAIQQLSISSGTVWALDNNGSLYYHKGISNNLELKKFGTEWVSVPVVDLQIKNIMNGSRIWTIVRDHFAESAGSDWLTSVGSWISWKHIELNTTKKANSKRTKIKDAQELETIAETIRHSSQSSVSSTSSSEIFDSISNRSIQSGSITQTSHSKQYYRLKLRLLDAFIFVLIFFSFFIFYKNLEIFAY